MLYIMNVNEILFGFKCVLNFVCIFYFDKNCNNIYV